MIASTTEEVVDHVILQCRSEEEPLAVVCVKLLRHVSDQIDFCMTKA